jgi:hypothetical protein
MRIIEEELTDLRVLLCGDRIVYEDIEYRKKLGSKYKIESLLY